nr:hypothetical protein CFP56_21231 [Quercus suber]
MFLHGMAQFRQMIIGSALGTLEKSTLLSENLDSQVLHNSMTETCALTKCQRCTRNNLECVVKDGFKRINKRMCVTSSLPTFRHATDSVCRNAKALYKQNEQLRQQLEAAALETSRGSQVKPELRIGEFMATTPISNPVQQYDLASTTVTLAEEISGGNLAPAPALDQNYRPHRPTATLPREIAGIRVEPFEIDDIFAL